MKPANKGSDTLQSSNRPATPVRQKSDASQANNGFVPTPPKQTATPTTPKQAANSIPPQQAGAPTIQKPAAAAPQTNGSKPPLTRLPSVKNVDDVIHTETPEVTILVKATKDVSIKYEKQLGLVVDVQAIYRESIESLLDFIATDRLRRVPHRGSRWDKILRMAEHFAIRISLFQEAVGSMFSKGRETARIIWGSCRALLKVILPLSFCNALSH